MATVIRCLSFRSYGVDLMGARTHVVVLSFSLPSFKPRASVVVRSARSSLFVESREAVCKLLHDYLATQLHARREIAGLDGELAVDDRESLDLLPAIQFQVQLVDVAGDQFLCFPIAGYLGEGIALQTMLAGPVGDRFVVEADQRHAVGLSLPVGEKLAHIRAEALEFRIDRRRRHV